MHHKTIEQQKEQIKLSNNDNRVDKKKQTRQLRTVQKKFPKSTELNGLIFKNYHQTKSTLYKPPSPRQLVFRR